jgi:RNA polymerase sigma factor for flagellar operon FliA
VLSDGSLSLEIRTGFAVDSPPQPRKEETLMDSHGSVIPEQGTTLRTLPSRPARGKRTTRQRYALFEQYHAVVQLEAAWIQRRLPPWIDLDSLIQSGMVGLLDALTRYDPRRKVTFGVYVRYRIRGEIMEYLRSLDWASRGVRNWGRKLDTARHRCRERLGRQASAAEIATELGISLTRYYELDQRIDTSWMLSLEQLVACPEQERDGGYEVPSPGPDPATVAEQRNLEAWMTAACEELSERDRLVLQLYYHEELTLKEIGESLGLTEGRICQLHSQAFLRLRKVLQEERCQHAALN